jgi:hypothetical protein
MASPVRDERRVLPSLTGLGKRGGAFPSHEWLGYFQGNSDQRFGGGFLNQMFEHFQSERGFYLARAIGSDNLAWPFLIRLLISGGRISILQSHALFQLLPDALRVLHF